MERPERIVVIGAGIGGLATALALEGSGCEVVIVERDDPPPTVAAAEAFDTWERPGVPQFRMSHSLVARLHTILRTHHPALLHELAQAGVEPCPIALVLPSTQIESYVPLSTDIDLRHLLGRRATFEYVLRRHVERLPHVRFMHGARVDGLRMQADGANLRVCGVEVTRGGQHEIVDGDLVVDASGGRAKVTDWLSAGGAATEFEEERSEFAYFSRTYRVLDGGATPFRRTGAILDYLWFGAFFAEDGHFSLALACPTSETQLIDAMRRPAGFDAIGRSLPGVADLLARSEVCSKVLGAAGLTNRWTRYVIKDKPATLGFFAVGDSHVQTNAMYGRGCAAAFMQAHALAATLRESADPVTRARQFSERVWTLLRPQYDFCVSADRLFAARAQRARGHALPKGLRSADYFTDQIWAPAVLESPFVARESVKTLQMQEMSGFWTRVAAIACMLLLWTRRGFRTAPRVPERSGPAREELLRTLEPALACARDHHHEVGQQR